MDYILTETGSLLFLEDAVFADETVTTKEEISLYIASGIP